MASTISALSYHEPDIVTILIFSSFLLLLNVASHVLDKTIYCGLIGQIFIGVGWGLPGMDWLPTAAQETVVELGYLGLILIVYEGGLSTSVKALKANLLLSSLVACIGISAPITLSFALCGLLDITPLQAFAAGAALCSTSLGTTFTVLSTSGLTESRLGTILTSAAMMDDVIGLVMVQVVSTLGGSSTSFNAVTVVRPVCVSIAFAVVVPLFCWFVIRPLTTWWFKYHEVVRTPESRSNAQQTVFLLHTGVLIAFITGASYAGISNLFAAYLAGTCITWWDETCRSLSTRSRDARQSSTGIEDVVNNEHASRPSQHVVSTETSLQTAAANSSISIGKKSVPPLESNGTLIYERYYGPAVSTMLKPFFFASIGFSIPITRMFSRSVIWKGIVYAALMTFGKLVCGLCLVRFGEPGVGLQPLRGLSRLDLTGYLPRPRSTRNAQPSTPPTIGDGATVSGTSSVVQPDHTGSKKQPQESRVPKPLTLYPAAILGSAMVARGEIGFLISSVAESNGVYSGKSDELFLVVTWAVLLCTLLGPITVGLLVRRVRSLQAHAATCGESVGRGDPLGILGFIDTSQT